jgi:hypothetical protein
MASVGRPLGGGPWGPLGGGPWGPSAIMPVMIAWDARGWARWGRHADGAGTQACPYVLVRLCVGGWAREMMHSDPWPGPLDALKARFSYQPADSFAGSPAISVDREVNRMLGRDLCFANTRGDGKLSMTPKVSACDLLTGASLAQTRRVGENPTGRSGAISRERGPSPSSSSVPQ